MTVHNKTNAVTGEDYRKKLEEPVLYRNFNIGRYRLPSGDIDQESGMILFTIYDTDGNLAKQFLEQRYTTVDKAATAIDYYYSKVDLVNEVQGELAELDYKESLYGLTHDDQRKKKVLINKLEGLSGLPKALKDIKDIVPENRVTQFADIHPNLLFPEGRPLPAEKDVQRKAEKPIRRL